MSEICSGAPPQDERMKKYVPDHVTFLNQVTYSSNLVQTELETVHLKSGRGRTI